jgi:hypothetical protein
MFFKVYYVSVLYWVCSLMCVLAIVYKLCRILKLAAPVGALYKACEVYLGPHCCYQQHLSPVSRPLLRRIPFLEHSDYRIMHTVACSCVVWVWDKVHLPHTHHAVYALAG